MYKTLSAVGLAVVLSQAPAFANPTVWDTASQQFVPVTPADPALVPGNSYSQSASSQGSRPIPTDLGVEFDLSNSGASGDTGSSSPEPGQSMNGQSEFGQSEFGQPEFGQSINGQSEFGQNPWQPPSPNQPVPSEQSAPQDAAPQPAPKSALDFFQQASFTLRELFARESDSLVAVAVGNAEGTRTPDGDRSKHFYGHTDPGNGVWNLGTFSYQHGASSAAEADVKQLNRLKQQSRTMQEKATAQGLKLTLEETLNGIDLANQAPKALLDSQGYIEWLAQAHAMGYSGQDAILWARVQSFKDPKTQRWNAPGLGNTAESITRDQQRRMQAIARAIDAQNSSISADARLNPQPIGFRLPQWNLQWNLQWSWPQRVIQTVAALFNSAQG
ncbi:MAG: hypothetical protein ACKO7W_17625 [Elainella sp.]